MPTLKSRDTRTSVTCTKILCYSPCGVQELDHPPHRLRCPLDLVRAEVYCHLKVVCRLNRRTLQHHHHCRYPEEEHGQRDAKRMKMGDLVPNQFL